jgi:hypothetical protein
MYTYLLLIDEDLCECRNVSVQFLCALLYDFYIRSLFIFCNELSVLKS